MVEINYATELPKAPEFQGVGVAAYGDFVIVSFLDGNGKIQAWNALDPKVAKEMGETLARSGHAVESKEDVYGKSSILVEQMRVRLVVAIEHLLKSDIINGGLDDPKMTAEKAVELMLTEAT